MHAPAKKRITVAVDARHIDYLRGCLNNVPHEDFTVSPIMSGWSVRGYWSSERAFKRVGERVSVSFITDPEPIRPLIGSGFGILAGDALTVRIDDLVN
jgi:hypothetical protein